MVQIYVDGVLDIEGEGSTATLNANMTLEMGHSIAENRDYRGLVDQVRLYNRVITDTERQALDNETAPSTDNGITAWYAAALPGLTHLQDLDLDPDGDGLTNLAEFAVNGDPLAQTLSPIEISPSGSAAALEVTSIARTSPD